MEQMKGLSCNDVNSIVEDVQGNMWIGILFGLCKFDKTLQRFASYYASTVNGIGAISSTKGVYVRYPMIH